MNVSVWDADFVRALRGKLLDEHLAADTRGITMRAAMALYRDTALANAAPSRSSWIITGANGICMSGAGSPERVWT